MIDAKEAMRQATVVRNEQLSAAADFAVSEWEGFIEPKILEACSKGEFKCSYFWCQEIFKDAQIYPYDFALAFKRYGKSLGYKVKTEEEVVFGVTVKVIATIDWSEIST